MAELAVIKTGGKQYLVSPGQKIEIEKLPLQEGSGVEFPEVLLLDNEKGLTIGTPLVEGAKAKGKVLKHGKREKLIVFHYRAKKRDKTKRARRIKRVGIIRFTRVGE